MSAQVERPVRDPDDDWEWAELVERTESVETDQDSALSPSRSLRLWHARPRRRPEKWAAMGRAIGEGVSAALTAAVGLAVAAFIVIGALAGAMALAFVWAAAALVGLAASVVAISLSGIVLGSDVAWRRTTGRRAAAWRDSKRAASASWRASRALASRSAEAGATGWSGARSALATLLASSIAAWATTRSVLTPPRVRRAAIGGTTAFCLITATVVTAALAPTAWRTAGAVLSADHAPLGLPPLAEGSQVFAADGRLVAVFHGSVNRRPVPLDQIAPVMRRAIVATEDVRFWRHGGVDLYALGRATVTDVLPGHDRQGGSTLAMQLVKNTLMAGHPDDFSGKVREAILANRLEAKIGPRGVLGAYLNTVYFGEGAYGVQAAAQTYFGVPASALTLPQAALLAGLVQNPVGYDPMSDPAEAQQRRRTVLDLMVKAGQIRPAQAANAASSPLPTTLHLPPDGRNFFLDAVKDELLANPALGSTPSARYHALYSGGLRIHTALDPTMEAQATKAVSQLLPQSQLRLSAALAAVDPSSGAVPAVVGGPDFATSQFDAALATPGRPTGSAFKVFTLVAALEKGWTASSYIDGSGPCTISDPGYNPNPWKLNNYEGEASGYISLTKATAQSVNCAFARLAMQVGLPAIARVAHQMGVKAPLAVVPSMTLGTNSIPPLQMASAYATLAAGGVYHQPHLVTRVASPSGKVLLSPPTTGVRVMSPAVAAAATSILQQVVQQGTGTAAQLQGRPVAGKTGTGANWADAWFVGYTPSLAAAVWMGAPSGEVPMLDVGGVNVAGGTYPARIWQSFESAATSSQSPGSFAPPPPGQAAPGTPAMGTGPGGTTGGTTWCWSSCGRGGGPP